MYLKNEFFTYIIGLENNHHHMSHGLWLYGLLKGNVLHTSTADYAYTKKVEKTLIVKSTLLYNIKHYGSTN